MAFAGIFEKWGNRQEPEPAKPKYTDLQVNNHYYATSLTPETKSKYIQPELFEETANTVERVNNKLTNRGSRIKDFFSNLKWWSPTRPKDLYIPQPQSRLDTEPGYRERVLNNAQSRFEQDAQVMDKYAASLIQRYNADNQTYAQKYAELRDSQSEHLAGIESYVNNLDPTDRMQEVWSRIKVLEGSIRQAQNGGQRERFEQMRAEIAYYQDLLRQAKEKTA